MEAFKLTTTMSAMLFAILAVIPDVLRFMSILLLWTTGCALTVYWLMVGENLEHEGLDDAMHIDIGDGHTDPTAVVYFYMLSYIKLTSVGVWSARVTLFHGSAGVEYCPRL